MEFESNVCWCGQVQGTLGVHALRCFAWWQLDQEACDLVNNLLATMCDAANIPFLKEHVHDFEEDANLRPDIVLLCHTPAGCDVALDVCVCDNAHMCKHRWQRHAATGRTASPFRREGKWQKEQTRKKKTCGTHRTSACSIP